MNCFKNIAYVFWHFEQSFDWENVGKPSGSERLWVVSAYGISLGTCRISQRDASWLSSGEVGTFNWKLTGARYLSDLRSFAIKVKNKFLWFCSFFQEIQLFFFIKWIELAFFLLVGLRKSNVLSVFWIYFKFRCLMYWSCKM